LGMGAAGVALDGGSVAGAGGHGGGEWGFDRPATAGLQIFD
jgi:hypothetical protein